MSFSFKTYLNVVDQEQDPTDEQLTEIFGFFRNNEKIERIRAARERAQQNAKKHLKPKNDLGDSDPYDKVGKHIYAKDKTAPDKTTNSPYDKVGKDFQKQPGRSAAAAGRAAELEYIYGKK